QDQQQPDANANGAVGHVEGWKPRLVAVAADHVEIQEVDDVIAKEAIDQVAQNAAKNQAERYLSAAGVNVEMVPGQEQDQQRDHPDRSQGGIVAPEQTPSGPGVTSMHEFEEFTNDRVFVAHVR